MPGHRVLFFKSLTAKEGTLLMDYEEELTSREKDQLLYAAAGRFVALQYDCPSAACKTEIFTILPVRLSCDRCRQKLVNVGVR